MTNSLLLALSLAIGQTVAVPERPAHDSSSWKSAIARFEAQDARSAPPTEAILFVGSSSIRLWDLPKYFPDTTVINRGFGGSQFADAAHFAEQLVIKHRPRIVVVYSGDNDVAAGKLPDEVHADFLAFVETVHAALPATKIVCISIKPSRARWHMRETMRAANDLIAATCAEHDHLELVDVWPAMLGPDGEKPPAELFASDGLHLSHEGYLRWTELLQTQLED